MKKIGAILLIAGTCIGSGMIALPLVLARIGLLPSLLLMGMIWFVMYYTSLISLELNLETEEGLSLGALGRKFSGPIAEWIGILSIKLLSYSLLAVFIYGAASIAQELLHEKISVSLSFPVLSSSVAGVAFLFLLLPLQWVDYFNRLLFITLLVIICLLILRLTFVIDWGSLPLTTPHMKEVSSWKTLLPVVFTSFGFQVIFHTLTKQCAKNALLLKKAFFWGSLIPAIVYLLWTCGVLSVVSSKAPYFYKEMVANQGDVGTLVQTLSQIAGESSIQLFIWILSLLAILTSLIGVGVGLSDSLQRSLKRVSSPLQRSLCAAFITLLPPYLIVLLIPNAFITVLGFAGMILAVIAILMPVYLYIKNGNRARHFKELNRPLWIYLSLLVAFAVIFAEGSRFF